MEPSLERQLAATLHRCVDKFLKLNDLKIEGADVTMARGYPYVTDNHAKITTSVDYQKRIEQRESVVVGLLQAHSDKLAKIDELTNLFSSHGFRDVKSKYVDGYGGPYAYLEVPLPCNETSLAQLNKMEEELDQGVVRLLWGKVAASLDPLANEFSPELLETSAGKIYRRK